MKTTRFMGSRVTTRSHIACEHTVKKKRENTIQNAHQSPRLDLSPSELATQHITDISHILNTLTVDSVSRYFGGNKYKPDNSTTLRIHYCIDEATKLVAPQATYRLFRVTQTGPGKKIILEEGAQLSLPDCIEVSGAQLVGVVIGTLGSGLESHCRYLASKNEIYQSTLFDAIGTAMLDLLSEHVSTLIVDRCARFGLARGPRFAPGIDDYSLEQQRVLFKLADHASIGVSLNSSAIMVPTKSISFLQTLAKSYEKRGLENKCSRCRMVTCQFRLSAGQQNH